MRRFWTKSSNWRKDLTCSSFSEANVIAPSKDTRDVGNQPQPYMLGT